MVFLSLVVSFLVSASPGSCLRETVCDQISVSLPPNSDEKKHQVGNLVFLDVNFDI